MNTRFYLREYGKTGVFYIWVDFRANGSRLRMSTNIEVKHNQWDAKHQQLKGINKTSIVINSKLKDIESQASNIYKEHLLANTTFTPEILKYEVLKEFSPGKAQKLQSIREDTKYSNLLSLLEYYIKENPKHSKYNTLKGYTTLSHLLREYAEKNGINSLDFDAIKIEFHEKFCKFLYAKDFRINTTDKQVKWIKALMTYATDKGWNTNMEYKKFRRKEESTFAISLSEFEIEKINELKVPIFLEAAKDEFVFSCYTGLRFSDLAELRKEKWEGDYISIRTVKTGDYIDIPLIEKAKRILEKYDGAFPQIPNAKYNKKIKKICSMIEEFDKSMILHSSAGNTRREVKMKKYDLVTSHTGRRSFATNAVLKGAAIPLVMNVTGHKTLSSFQKYIKIDQKQKARILLNTLNKKDSN